MEWRDAGIILNVRRLGENDAIVEALTAEHGRHSGVVKGGAGRRHRGILQAGNEVDLLWRARLDAHLGTYSLEPLRSRSATFLAEPDKLSALLSICTLASVTLAERQSHKPLYEGLLAVLDALEQDQAYWGAVLVRWELGLLDELGFGLDLSKCAGTGGTDNLVYVSPRSGAAVSDVAGEPYKNMLLPLPAFLTRRESSMPEIEDVLAGLKLTGYFIDKHMLEPNGKSLPDARQRMINYLAKKI